jgi:CRP/FNR family cyclic AMP-dependent transcriptional regulator
MSAVDPPSLTSVPLFRGLPAEALARLAERLRRRVFPAGSSVITAQEPGEGLYILLAGSVKIFLDEADGAEVTLAFLGPGDSVGEMSLVDRAGRSANVVTREESVLLWMDRATFTELLRDYPALTENLVRELAARLRSANDMIRALTTLDVGGRVARELLVLADQYGQSEPAGTRIALALNQREIADIVGATRERVNRVLVALKRQGTISVDPRHRITLHDREALRRMCARDSRGV